MNAMWIHMFGDVRHVLLSIVHMVLERAEVFALSLLRWKVGARCAQREGWSGSISVGHYGKQETMNTSNTKLETRPPSLSKVWQAGKSLKVLQIRGGGLLFPLFLPRNRYGSHLPMVVLRLRWMGPWICSTLWVELELW